jgi:hypothetical protein
MKLLPSVVPTCNLLVEIARNVNRKDITLGMSSYCGDICVNKL